MNDDTKNLLFVEYDGRGRPFNVMTAGEDNLGMHQYHFEWSNAFGYNMYNLTGGGGNMTAILGEFCKLPKRKRRFWARRDILIVARVEMGKKWQRGRWENDHYRNVILEPEDCARMGYRRLDEPLQADPFADAVMIDAVYCRTCRDWFPHEDWNFCRHLKWCDECEQVVHVTRAGHIGWDKYRVGDGERVKHKGGSA